MEKHISWIAMKEKELENQVRREYAGDEVRKHLVYLTSLIRRAGTDDERKAAGYIAGKLKDYGIEQEIYEFDAYINQPGKADLHIISPVKKSFPALPGIFSASTPPGGMEAEIIFLRKGSEDDFQGADVRGRIVLLEPEGMEGQLEAARIGEETGAAAQIYVTKGKPQTISIGQYRSSWGNPTPDTMDKLPRTPAVSICSEDGKELAAIARNGPVKARLFSDSWRGYKKILLPTGCLPGRQEPEKYVLVSGHYCSWFTGATDNAAANSLMLEMARIFSNHRKSLARGIRFAWWTGHEQGLYAGSTWYLDNFWDDIRDNAVAYLVMDGLGRADASGFEARNTEDIRKFHELIIKEILGVATASKRVPKFGDQTFWGMGLPSLTGRPGFTAEQAARMGMDPIWYSHAAEDTLDKVDMDLLPLPFAIYATTALRIVNSPILPFEYVTMAGAFEKVLLNLQDKSNSALDLTSLIDQARELKKKAEALNKGIEKHLVASEGKRRGKKATNARRELNACLMELGRILIPALSSEAGRYGQDPMGAQFKPLPELQGLATLASLDRDSEAYMALRTSLVRARNKLSDTFHAAHRLLEATLSRI